MDLQETKALLSRYGIAPIRSLGQNFLVDGPAQQRILEELGCQQEDLVLEIGPGAGVLSGQLAGKCAHLMLVEIDRHLIPLLQARFEGDRTVTVLHEDAMALDYQTLVPRWREALTDGHAPIRVVSNLPYYITTPMISKLITEIPECSRFVFTLQKEAADRIMAPTGSAGYGVLSVLAQHLYTMQTVAELQASCFHPQPGVDSVVLSMAPNLHGRYTSKEIRDFEKFIKASFGQRRKTLANALAGAWHLPGGKESVGQALQAVGLPATARAQELSPDLFRAVYLLLKKESST